MLGLLRRRRRAPRGRTEPAPHRLESPRGAPVTPGPRRAARWHAGLLRAQLRARCLRTRRSIVAETEHGGRFPSLVAAERVIGFQFHPERSGDDGLRMLAQHARAHRRRRTPGVPDRARGRRHRLMLLRRVIPCLDVRDGRVVKGVRFVDLTDEGDPPELAARYAAAGADEICFLDITAAPEGRGTLLDVVERTASRVFVPLTVGGGVRSAARCATCCAPAPTRSPSTRPRCAIPTCSRARAPGASAASASSSASMPAPRPGAPGSWEVVVQGGRDADRPGCRRMDRARRSSWCGRGAADLDRSRRDPGRASTSPCCGRSPRGCDVPVIASGGAGSPGRHDRGRRRRATPMPCWRPRSSTATSTPSPRSRPTWRRPACPVRLVEGGA